MRASFAVFFVLLALSSCTLHQGHERALSAEELYTQATDLDRRGDTVGADHLLERLARDHAGSYFTILGELYRQAWIEEKLSSAIVGSLGAERVKNRPPACVATEPTDGQ